SGCTQSLQVRSVCLPGYQPQTDALAGALVSSRPFADFLPVGGAELLLQSRARSATGLLRHCDSRALCRRTAQQWAGAIGVLFRAGQCGDLRCLMPLPVGQAHDRLEAVGAMNFSTVKEFSE